MTLRNEHPVERAVLSDAFISIDGNIIVAVSGGADSMALVEAVRRLRPPEPGCRLFVAHFDHRLRPDSARDAEVVAAYAQRHGLEFMLGTDDVLQHARSRRQSIEEAARELRYSFLWWIAWKHHARLVLTAHTKDDQVETILMRILRGTGTYGLAGIPERRGLYVRPFMSVTHTQTIDYCKRHGVSFVEDPTNVDRRFVRNRIRHDVLPALRGSFPGIDAALLRLSDNARRERERLANVLDPWCSENVIDHGSWLTIRLAGFAGLDNDEATERLHAGLRTRGWSLDVGRPHYERLAHMILRGRTGLKMSMPGFWVRREHDALVLRRQFKFAVRVPRDSWQRHEQETSLCDAAEDLSFHEHERDERLWVDEELKTTMCFGGWLLETKLISADQARHELSRGTAANDIAYFDADAVGTQLVVRSVRRGDRMRPFGLNGHHKKISDLFIDRKVPRRYRAQAIAVEAGSILWVPRLAASEDGRVGTQTRRVIRLKATRT